MSRFDSAEPLAVFLPKRRGRSVRPQTRHFDNIDAEVSTVVDNRLANEAAAHSIQRFHCVTEHEQAAFHLQLGLGTVLSLSDPHNDWDIPDAQVCDELVGKIYQVLGHSILSLSGDIDVDQLIEGMLAAARLVRDIENQNFEGDRREDDKTRVKILINFARIAEHRKDIDQRRDERHRRSVETMKQQPKQATLAG